MFYFSDRKELWRTRCLSWQKTESVDGLRLLETAGVCVGVTGTMLSSLRSFCLLCPGSCVWDLLLPTLSCPGSVLLSVFSQWSHAPASCLCLCVLGVSLRPPHSAPHPRHHLLPAWLSGHTLQRNTLICGCVGIAIRRRAGFESCSGKCSRWPIVTLAMPKPGGQVV